MHQGWSVGVCLLMQSLGEEGERERKSGEENLASYVCIMHMQSCRSNLDKIFRARMYRRSQQCDGTAASKQPVPAYRDITAKTCNTVPNPCKALESMPRTMVQQSSIAQTLQSQAEYSLIRVQMISLVIAL